MTLSGQITAHEAHPVQASGLAMKATGYPLLLTSADNSKTPHGHEATQTPHPLQRSLSTTIAPLILAIMPIVSIRNKYNEKIANDNHRGAKKEVPGRAPLGKDGEGKTERYSSKLWMTTPERSLGSNQVVLGGMMLPVSAMSMSCCMETG